MSLWIFLRDQWRLGLFSLLGFALLTAALVLAASEHGSGIPFSDILYAFLLAAACDGIFLCVEYWLRRPFYQEAQSRIRGTNQGLHGAGVFVTAATAEQRLFLQVLHTYYNRYARELSELEERRRFFQTFSTRFVHQMKTPVTAIQLMEQELRQLVGSRPEIAEQVLPVLDSLAQECARLDGSLGAMLSTARLHAFEFDARFEAFDLLAALREVVNEHKRSWIRQSMYPKIECDRERVVVSTDRKWFRFIADQIVRNALQYGYRAEAETHVFRIRLTPFDEAVRIDFADNGIGIPQRDVRRVFDPFYTGANGRTHSRATGMGLYLVREVANRLGMDVSISSAEGVGTTVSVTVPRERYFQPMTHGGRDGWGVAGRSRETSRPDRIADPDDGPATGQVTKL
ncbi:MAG: sensor histidine kinase [Alicyclobacillus sp.]|nr:sensor histidine kinase [Alicyclobacillus sp.]